MGGDLDGSEEDVAVPEVGGGAAEGEMDGPGDGADLHANRICLWGKVVGAEGEDLEVGQDEGDPGIDADFPDGRRGSIGRERHLAEARCVGLLLRGPAP